MERPLPLVEPTFCPLCSAPLEPRQAHGARRLACPRCEFVHFNDPKVAVGVLVEDAQGRLLYTQRNHDPQMGAWAFPSGFVDRAEELRAAAVREVREETGLDVAVDGLLGVFSQSGNPVVFIAYHGHPVGGALSPGAEATDVRFFATTELPPPAFPFDTEILAAWRATRRAAIDR